MQLWDHIFFFSVFVFTKLGYNLQLELTLNFEKDDYNNSRKLILQSLVEQMDALQQIRGKGETVSIE